MVDSETPTFHIGMESALHDEKLSSFGHVDLLFDRLAGQVLVTLRSDKAFMVRIHRKRSIEQNPWPQMRRLVRLDIVHHRVHVHDDHISLITHDRYKWEEPAVPRFDSRRFKFKRFAL